MCAVTETADCVFNAALPVLCRKGCILRLQRHLHELLLDQLPVLRQLARVLDEMSLGIDNAAAANAANGGPATSRLILEQVGHIWLWCSTQEYHFTFARG